MPDSDAMQDWNLNIEYELDTKYRQNVIIAIVGCSPDGDCAAAGKDADLFEILVVGSPKSLIRRVKEDYVIAPTYFILAFSSLVILILSTLKKEQRWFNLLT